MGFNAVMKALLSTLAVCAVGTAFTAMVIVDLLIRLTPLLIVAGLAWALLAAGARHRDQAGHPRLSGCWADQRLPFRPAPAAPRRVSPPIPPPPTLCTQRVSAPAHAPVTRHHKRYYLDIGDNTGVTAPRNDSYLCVLYVAAPAMAPAAAARPFTPGTARRHRRITRNRPRP